MQIGFVSLNGTFVVVDSEIEAVVGVHQRKLLAFGQSGANDGFLDVFLRRLVEDSHGTILVADFSRFSRTFLDCRLFLNIEVEDVAPIVVMLQRDRMAVYVVAVSFDCGVC